jgi:hypothetical protein
LPRGLALIPGMINAHGLTNDEMIFLDPLEV